jgi:hypothetical protein
MLQKLEPDRTLSGNNRLIIKWMDEFSFARDDLSIFPRLLKALVKRITYQSHLSAE